MATILEVQAAQISPVQLEALRGFASNLEQSQLRDLLLGLTTTVGSGSDVALFESDSELTPNQVAQHLSMSRTHLYKMLDSGELASHTVGRDRRIRFADVAAFEMRRQQSRRQLAERFAHSDASRAAAIDEIADEL
ncbi:MAG: helix-turn-helix domain-containing protein [Rhodoglobus sp.]